MAFDYLSLRPGDMVEISLDGTFNDTAPATVAKVETDCAQLQFMWGQFGMIPLSFCWHEEDARAKEPHRFEQSKKLLEDEENPDAMPQTALFRLTRNQEILQSFPAQLAALNNLVENLAERVAEMEASFKQDKSTPARRARQPVEETIGA